MIEAELLIETDGGAMQTFICHPERGSHPVIILYMDAFGIREELRNFARRLGTAGYYVMLPNLYHRMGVHELGPLPEDVSGASLDHLMQCVSSLTVEQVLGDTRPLFVHAAADQAARDGSVGCVGYCMSGWFSIAAAAQFGERVKAAASIFGTRLVTESPMSPHRAACRAPGEIYFACAEVDHWAPLEDVAALRASLQSCGANAEVELYEGTGHAFAFTDRSTYDRVADDRHWERLFALFRRNLG